MANEQAPGGDAGPASPASAASERGTAPGRARRPPDLLDQVVAEGLLTAAQVREVRSLRLATGLPAAQCVADLGFVTEERIVAALSKITGLPVEDPLATDADPSLVALIPLRTVRRRGVFPLRREGSAVVVATCSPRDVLALDEARAHLGAPIRLVIAAPSKIVAAAERAYRPAQAAALETLERVEGPAAAAAEGRTIEWHAEEAAHAAEDTSLEEETVEAAAEAAVADSPVVKLVGLIFEDAVRRRASDIHIEPAADCVRVRFRIDGVLRDVQTLPRSVRAFVTTRVKVNARMDPTVTRRPQDARTTLLAEGRSIDARVSTLPTIHGEKIVVRLLDAGRDDLGLERIFPPEDLAAFESVVLRPQGLVLVTGPTGSGKTTTLYAALRRLAERTRNVVTLEDPVEYRLEGVNQVQVSSEMGFLDGLRSILRQDPDVVLVGEIRDAETARVAFQAANVGQLVLSTLHTNDAAAAAARLFDLGAEPYAVAEGLNGIVAQRLCRLLCARCKSPSPSTEAEVERWGATIRGASIQRPVGCEECDFEGYRGRVAAYEVLRVNAEVKAHLLEKGSEQAIRRAARQAGMRSMLHAALARVLAGETSLEALERAIPHDAAQEERRCAACRADIFVGQRACTSCGASVRPACAACGVEVRPEWRFCGACAAPLEGADAAPAPPATAAEGTPPSPPRSAPDPASPVLVAGTGAFAERIALGLAAVGYAVLRAPTEAQALREALTRRVRAVVLDFDWERSHALAQKLRRRLEMAGTPVLIAVEPEEVDARADAEEAAPETPPGTRPDDYVDRSLVPDEVGRRVGLAVRRGGRWAKGGNDQE